MTKLTIKVESDYETELLITILENILKDDKIFGEAEISKYESDTIIKMIESVTKPTPYTPPYKPVIPSHWNDKPYPTDPNKVYFIAKYYGIEE